MADENGHAVGHSHRERGPSVWSKVTIGLATSKPPVPMPHVGKHMVAVNLSARREARRCLVKLASEVGPAAHDFADRLGTHHAKGPDLARRGEGDDSEVGEVGYVLRIV